MPTNLQSLFIVQRDRPDLYESLCLRFGEGGRVILDRRQGERRRANGGAMLERRRGDRREPLARAERELWQSSGYCVIFQPPEASTQAGTSLPTA